MQGVRVGKIRPASISAHVLSDAFHPRLLSYSAMNSDSLRALERLATQGDADQKRVASSIRDGILDGALRASKSDIPRTTIAQYGCKLPDRSIIVAKVSLNAQSKYDIQEISMKYADQQVVRYKVGHLHCLGARSNHADRHGASLSAPSTAPSHFWQPAVAVEQDKMHKSLPRRNTPATLAPLSVGHGSAINARIRRVVKPALEQHKRIMDSLPVNLSAPDRSAINRLLCHIEKLGMRWSVLRGKTEKKRPTRLEKIINEGMQYHGLNERTRRTVNRVFMMSLMGSRNVLTPWLEEHQTLLQMLPTNTSLSRRLAIRRMLCHLEQMGLVWSDLRGDEYDCAPVALENFVNSQILNHSLFLHTRAALNQVYGLRLRGPSAIRKQEERAAAKRL